MIIYVLTYQTNMQTNIFCVLCILLISANKSMLLPTGDWIDNIKSLILSYIVNSQTCELERNAKLIGLSGQPSVYTGVQPSRERSAALTPPVGSKYFWINRFQIIIISAIPSDPRLFLLIHFSTVL